MNADKLITENFVNELLKDGSWDIARTRPEPIIEEAREETVVEEAEEEVTAAQLAEELLANLSDEVILEFVNLLHAVALKEAEEEKGEEKGEEIDEAFIPLFNTIDESYTALEKEYDLSDSTVEEIMEAMINSMDEDDLEDYEAEQIMEALIIYLNEEE